MPEFVNMSVGSFGGMMGALGWTLWPRSPKKERKEDRTNWDGGVSPKRADMVCLPYHRVRGPWRDAYRER
jgi:hypothetical protein